MHLPKRVAIPRPAILAGLIAAAAMAQTSPNAWSATRPEIISRCESCHGAGGDSQVTTTPRLNGQPSGYIVDRLKKLSRATKNPHFQMGMFKELSATNDATIMSVATYFSSQPPTKAKPGARAAEGKLIFEKGSEEDNVIACNQCHGAAGEGHDTTPRIAGQHADYLKAQLRLFNLKFRDHVLMKPNTKTMTGKTVDALTGYLAND